MPDQGFRVEEREGCTLVFGPTPMRELIRLTSSAPAGAVMSHHLARLAGASIAYGLPGDIDRLTASMRAQALEAPLPVEAAHLSPGAAAWLKAGEQGMSSAVLFKACTSVHLGILDGHDSSPHHPYDPGDFRRCHLLIEEAPEVRDHFRRVMPALSPTWRALIERWDDIVSAMDAECPGWRTSPSACQRADTMIRQIIDAVDPAMRAAGAVL